MESVNVPLICYCDGELVDQDRNAKYIGGHTKVGLVSKNISSFSEFTKKVQAILDLSMNRGASVAFEIKCRYRVDEFTVIAVNVADDQSLKFVMERSHLSNAIILYIVKKHWLPKTTSTINNNRTAREPNDSSDLEEVVEETKTRRGVGRPRQNKKKNTCTRCGGKMGHHTKGCTNPRKGKNTCTRCGGKTGHHKQSCNNSPWKYKKTCRRCWGKRGHHKKGCPIMSQPSRRKELCTRWGESGHDRRSCKIGVESAEHGHRSCKNDVEPKERSVKVEDEDFNMI